MHGFCSLPAFLFSSQNAKLLDDMMMWRCLVGVQSAN